MTKVFILGMDGNVLENYHIKSESAGKALQKNLADKVNLSVKEGANIYIQTSGRKSLLQWEYAYTCFTGKQTIPKTFVENTEKDFRAILKQKLTQTKMYEDAKDFLTWAKGISPDGVFVTTTVPLETIPDICNTTQLDRYVTRVLTRGGVYFAGQKIEIKNFDKGQPHYDYVKEETNVNDSDIISISSVKRDIEIAKEQSVLSIGLEHIFTKEQLLEFGADKVFPDFLKVREFVQGTQKKDDK